MWKHVVISRNIPITFDLGVFVYPCFYRYLEGSRKWLMFDVCIALWAPRKRISCTQIKLARSQWPSCCSLRWCFLELALYSYLAWWTPWAVLCIYDYIIIYICIYISIRFTTDIIYYSHVLPQWQLFQCDFVLRGILAGDFIDFASGFIRWTALSGSGTVKAAAWEGLRFWGFPDRHGSREHPKKNIQCWPCSKERTIVFG
jgi:hypothetical protein